MLYFIKNLYTLFLLPPGIFIVLLLIFVFYLYRLNKKAARLLLMIVFTMYLASTPLVGELLLRTLESQYTPPPNLQGDVLVMLGGGATLDTPDINGAGMLLGSSLSRLFTTARLARATGLPIIISTGQVYPDGGNEATIARSLLIELGIPGEKILLDNDSLNTMASVQNLEAILMRNQFRAPVLITSAYHMPRSVRSFAKYHIAVQPYPCDYMVNAHQSLYINKLLPSYGGLQKTGVALREYGGMIPTCF